MKSVQDHRKVVVVGGVAGGMSAAARARRISESAEIIVLERGAYVSFANCGLPYYLGGEIEQQDDLILQNPAALKARFNLDVRVLNEVVAIDSEAKVLTVKDLSNGRIYQESYDDLILSVGAKPIRPPVPGIDLAGVFTVRTLDDVAAIENWITTKQPRRVAIAGAGFIGLEMAEQMHRRGFEVTLLDGLDQVLAPLDGEMAGLVQAELVKKGVAVRLGGRLTALLPPSEKSDSSAALACWLISGEHPPLAADMVIVGLGVRPDIAIAERCGLEIGQLGGIRVDEYLRTSKPGIWAVGDAVEVRQPVSGEWALIALGGPANRQGRAVADNIFGGKTQYKGSIGTAVLRVFDLTVACTGLNEKTLKRLKMPYEQVLIHPSQHAGYYPGSRRIDLKLLFHGETGVILGAQAVGVDGVDKRIDIIATAIKAGMTVRDLADLELAYAPPFGSAKDAVNLAGMAASNILDKTVQQMDWPAALAAQHAGAIVLDVRSVAERERGFVPDSLNIPLNELRNRLSELPRQKKILVYCQSGQRSYFAARLLAQKNFIVRNIIGGYLTYLQAVPGVETKLSSSSCLAVNNSMVKDSRSNASLST